MNIRSDTVTQIKKSSLNLLEIEPEIRPSLFVTFLKDSMRHHEAATGSCFPPCSASTKNIIRGR